jgi:hypothetical protein
MNTSGVKVAEPFCKRSPLRELAEYFFQGRLSREDYTRHRQNLIDHLCGLESRPDPLVLMLIRQSESARDAITDINETKDRPTVKATRDDLGVTAAARAAIPRAPTEVRQAVQVPSPDEDAGDMGVVKPESTEGLPTARLIVAAAVLVVVALLAFMLWPAIFVTH